MGPDVQGAIYNEGCQCRESGLIAAPVLHIRGGSTVHCETIVEEIRRSCIRSQCSCTPFYRHTVGSLQKCRRTLPDFIWL